MSETDIVERLRRWISYKPGDLPASYGMLDWCEPLQHDVSDAIAEIEQLRRDYQYLRAVAGPIAYDPNFATIRQDLKTL